MRNDRVERLLARRLLVGFIRPPQRPVTVAAGARDRHHSAKQR